MKKENLLSIGNFSKLTGVHIKSLRYYDKIGILNPAYIDPKSGYRYYTFSQIHIVGAIQLCVELGIPLKNFSMFMTKSNRQIQYDSLLEQGTKLADIKINSIQEKINFALKIRKDFKRTQELITSNIPAVFNMQKKSCIITPYNGKQTDEEYFRILQKIFFEISEIGLRNIYECGLLFLFEEDRKEQFIFVDVEVDVELKKESDFKNIIYIPEGKYLCKKVGKSDIQKAPIIFPELFEKAYNKIIIETELFTGDYNYLDPVFELRCSLPSP